MKLIYWLGIMTLGGIVLSLLQYVVIGVVVLVHLIRNRFRKVKPATLGDEMDASDEILREHERRLAALKAALEKGRN